MQLIREKRIGDVYTSTYTTHGYVVNIQIVNGDPSIITVTCEPEKGVLYKPKIICSQGGICIAYENIYVSYREDARWMDEMIGEACNARDAAREIYLLLKELNFFT